MNWFDRWTQNIGPGQAVLIAVMVVALTMLIRATVQRWVSQTVRGWVLNVLTRTACLAVAVLATIVVFQALSEGQIRWFSRHGQWTEPIRREESPSSYWLNVAVTAGFGLWGLRIAVRPLKPAAEDSNAQQ